MKKKTKQYCLHFDDKKKWKTDVNRYRCLWFDSRLSDQLKGFSLLKFILLFEVKINRWDDNYFILLLIFD